MKKELADFFKIRPGMLEKYEYTGTFKDYAGDLAGKVKFRQQEVNVGKGILNQAKRIMTGIDDAGGKSLELLDRQLSDFPIISYADHHGLLNYKLLYNSNILYAEMVKKLQLPFLVVFAAGNVPLDNMSYPRGFYFKKQRFNFFGADESRTPVFLFEKKLCALKKIGLNSFINGTAKDALTLEEKKFLEFLFFEKLEIEKAGEIYESYSDQITFLNYRIWPYFFTRSLRDTLPELIYLQSNPVILTILIEEIKKKDSLISMILFEPHVRRIYLRNFFATAGCWGENTGSQLFWGITKKKNYKKLIRLFVDESTNTLAGENFCLQLERETICEALNSKKIAATLFFDYLIITFLSGYVVLGGFNQLEYLPQMQRAHIKSLREIGQNSLADLFASCVTNGLVCGMLPCKFDSSIDLIWHCNSHNGKFNGELENGLTQDYLAGIANMKLREMILPAVEIMLQNISIQK